MNQHLPAEHPDHARIALFCDGRPGHEKQSRGIVKALQRYISVEVHEIRIRKRTLFQELCAYAGYVAGRQKTVSVGDHKELIIGCGSRTHIPMLVYARGKTARTVVCMTPPWPLRSRFDLCCSPMHDRVAPADNIIVTIGPPNTAEAGGDHDPTAGLLCIGGLDPSSHVWEEERLLDNIRALLEKADLRRWTLTSSPRTPQQTETALQALADEFSRVTLIPFSQTGPGWIEEQYRRHQTVWITADSISMVYEALSAGCRVGLLPVRWKKRTSKFQLSEHYLIRKGLVVPFAAWLSDSGQWQAHDPLTEADRCAKEILRRWWPKNVP